jgi:hypothetical protein
VASQSGFFWEFVLFLKEYNLLILDPQVSNDIKKTLLHREGWNRDSNLGLSANGSLISVYSTKFELVLFLSSKFHLCRCRNNGEIMKLTNETSEVIPIRKRKNLSAENIYFRFSWKKKLRRWKRPNILSNTKF